MKKLLMRKKAKKKFDLVSEISLYEPDQCRVIKPKEIKVTARSSTIRSKTVANLIKNEIQAGSPCV